MSLTSTIRDLHRRKGRERRGLALAEGVRLVEELLASTLECEGSVISPSLESTPRGRNLVELLTVREMKIVRVDEKEFASLSATEHPQGIVVVYRPAEFTWQQLAASDGSPLVVLDGLQDPGNVGTIARTAVAFGAAGLVALPGTVDLNNPKVVRASAGALFRLPNLQIGIQPLIAELNRTGTRLLVTVMNGEAIVDVRTSGPMAICLGNEGAGVSEDLLRVADHLVAVPIRPEVESLNVAVTAGILLHRLGSA